MTITAHLERMIELLKDPQHWTQRAWARTAKGNPVPHKSKSAVCFCQASARYKTAISRTTEEDVYLLLEAVADSMGYQNLSKSSALYLNDTSNHNTVMEMLYTAFECAKGAEV